MWHIVFLPLTMTKKSIAKEVNSAPNWESRINLVCQRLRIPGVSALSHLLVLQYSLITLLLCYGTLHLLFTYFLDLESRAGLKQIHKTFPEVYQRLRTSYRDNSQHPGVQGIIATIYARMCNDALLRNKLFKEGDLSRLPCVPRSFKPLYIFQDFSRKYGPSWMCLPVVSLLSDVLLLWLITGD